MNIILQHWSGDVTDLVRLSSDNIKKYASDIGADYQLLLGDVFDDRLRGNMQKLFMLDEQFDHYENVVMVDVDMFTRNGMNSNIFEEEGIGVNVPRNQKLHQDFVGQVKRNRDFPQASLKYPYWGGSIYKLNRDLRQRFRKELSTFGHHVLRFLGPKIGLPNKTDEGAMHLLATRCKLPTDGAFLPIEWSAGSFEKRAKQAHMIHVRTKYNWQWAIDNNQPIPRRSKEENYNEMIECQLIDGPKIIIKDEDQ